MNTSTTRIYQAPRLTVIGEVRLLTLGEHFSCPDGNSGNVGNKSDSDPTTTCDPQ
jgi:hypothetical protein